MEALFSGAMKAGQQTLSKHSANTMSATEEEPGQAWVLNKHC